MDIISRLPGCNGQSSRRNICVHSSKMEDAPKLLRIPKCPNIWVRIPRHRWPKSWSNIEDPVVPLERKLFGRIMWERKFEHFLMELKWEKIPNWECLFVHRKQGLFLSIYVGDKMSGKKQNMAPTWKKLMKGVDLDEPTFLDHVYLVCTQRECEPNEGIVVQYKNMFESRVSAGATEKLPGWKKNFAREQQHGPMTWRDTPKNAWRDIVKWQTKKWSNCTKFQVFAWMIITSKRRNLHQWENCPKCAPKLYKKKLVLGTNWLARHFMVTEQTCTIRHNVDRSL